MEQLASSDTPTDPHAILIVLDLNGTLVYRSKNNSKSCNPRPYLSEFLRYLFHPTSPFEVMVWSSARRTTVDKMLNNPIFDPFRESFLAVWAREELGLSAKEFANKVATAKDLRRVWSAPKITRDRTSRLFSSTNTVLLDDSPSKGRLQPFSQIELPSFDSVRFQASLNPNIPAGDTLFAAIGILDALRATDDVEKWLQQGGIWLLGSGGNRSCVGSADNPLRWFDDIPTFEMWVTRGKTALCNLEAVSSKS